MDLVSWLISFLFGWAVGRDKPWWIGGLASAGCFFGVGITILLLVLLAEHLG